MKNINKGTKIIATIGPASNSYEIMKELALAGMTTIRLNFSHGTRDEQLENMKLANRISKELKSPISIMLDTKGPEIRVGKIKDGGVHIESGKLITIKTGVNDFQTHLGDANQISVSYQMHLDVKIGSKILFDDGKLLTTVEKVMENSILVRTSNAHFLKTNKRINLPGIDFSLPFVSKKDIEDIRFGIKHGINYIATSFTNTAKDVQEIRKILAEENASHIKIIPKIESVLGVKNIEEIIQASDGIMIARGDLGLEVPFEDVPIIEKVIIAKCRYNAKPSIVATQMLDSMERTPIPTRAEVTDIYFAVYEGADSTMLSGESASGLFPVLSVKTMAKIARRAEKAYYASKNYDNKFEITISNLDDNIHNQMAIKVARMASSGKYRCAIIFTKNGETLDAVSRLKPNLSIIGVVSKENLVGAFGISASVFNWIQGPEYYNELKSNKNLLLKFLNEYNIVKGEKYLVVHRDNVEEFTF